MADSRRPVRSYKELTLQQLRSFHAVCRLGGFAAAGREMLLTPPAVWEQIQGLEKFYGATLFVRHGNGMAPTTEGLRLLELTSPLLAGLDTTRETFRQEIGILPESLRLASNLRVYAAELVHALKAFQRVRPGIRFELAFLRDEQLEEEVLQGKVDVALTLQPGPRGLRQGLEYEVCGQSEFLLVATKSHPIAKLTKLSLADFTKYPLILGDGQTYSRQRVQEVFHRHHMLDQLQLAIETNSDEYSTLCVRSGMGLAITIGSPNSSLYRGLHTRSLRYWFGSVQLGFLWKCGSQHSPVHQELAQMVRRTLSAVD